MDANVDEKCARRVSPSRRVRQRYRAKYVLPALFALCSAVYGAVSDASVDECLALLQVSPGEAELVCSPVLTNPSPDVDRPTITRIQIDLATGAVTRGEFDRAEQYLADALFENDTLLDNNFYRFNWLRIKALVFFKQDKFAAAIPYMRDALKVAQALGNPRSIATCHNDLGASYLEMGDYGSALTSFQAALEHLRGVGNHYSIALTLANTASVYRESGDLPAAVEYLEQSLEAHALHLKENPDDFYAQRAIAQVREDLGVTYTQTGQLKEAREALADAFSTYQAADLKLDQVRVLSANAEIELEAGNPAAAMVMLERAQQLEAANPPKRFVQLRRSLVATHLATGEWRAAYTVAQEGLSLSRTTDQVPDELFFLKALSELAVRFDQIDEALNYQAEYFEKLRASLEDRYRLELAASQNSLEFERQEESIALLEAEGVALKRSLQLQRWLVIGSLIIVVLLLLIVAQIWRFRVRRRSWLTREIALHRQEFESDPVVEMAGDDEDAETGEDGREDDFNRALVRLMGSCIELWEQVTGDTRIELAEKSRIWQVTVDNGRLRTRTMDRYCDLKKLPKVPRWRQVVRTCRYILINCELSEAQRQRLNDELEQVFDIQRRKSLSPSV
ncbi:MAG: tetratricopeptide repeat protein [Pseudomonadota bacterium]